MLSLTPLHRSRRRRSLLLSISIRYLHSLDLTNPTFFVFSSNTSVGKTLISTGLANSVLSSTDKPSTFLYLKPIQTGFPSDSDSDFVFRKISHLFRLRFPPSAAATLFASNHTIRASNLAQKEMGRGFYEEIRVGGAENEEDPPMRLVCKTVFGWREAVSPHLAEEREGLGQVDDSTVRDTVARCLEEWKLGDDGRVWRVVEASGGVASPGPSGSLQCDLYRPFRLPVVLVGDGRLGGISATISAYESLKIRGYDVVTIVLVDHGLSNEVSLMSYLRKRVDVLVLPPIPEDPSNNLIDWFCESSKVFDSLLEILLSAHLKKIQRLHDMPRKAGNILWWPFTQHKLVPEQTVTVIDSRYGENFAVHKVCNNRDMIIPQFDACASWWTQGPDATLQLVYAVGCCTKLNNKGKTGGKDANVLTAEVYLAVLSLESWTYVYFLCR